MRLELCFKLNFILLSKTNSFKSPERHWRNSDSVFWSCAHFWYWYWYSRSVEHTDRNYIFNFKTKMPVWSRIIQVKCVNICKFLRGLHPWCCCPRQRHGQGFLHSEISVNSVENNILASTSNTNYGTFHLIRTTRKVEWWAVVGYLNLFLKKLPRAKYYSL